MYGIIMRDYVSIAVLLLISSLAYADLAVTPGSGASIGTDDISSVKYQKVKLMDGTAGSSTLIKADASGNLQVNISSAPSSVTLKVDGSAVTQPVSGTITANAGTGNFSVTGSTVSILGTVPVSGTVAATQSGTYTTNAFVTNVPTMTVSGTLTTNAYVTNVPTVTVSGTVASTQSGGWTVTANAGSGNFNVTGSTVIVSNPSGTNIVNLNSNTISLGNGASAAGTTRVAIASDNTVFTVNTSTSIGSYTPGAYIVCQSTFANVAASQTDSSLVSGITSTKIRVIATSAVAGATATNLTFNSKGAGAGTPISSLFANAANGGFVFPEMRMGWFETNSGEALTVTTGAGSTTGILVYYCKI